MYNFPSFLEPIFNLTNSPTTAHDVKISLDVSVGSVVKNKPSWVTVGNDVDEVPLLYTSLYKAHGSQFFGYLCYDLVIT